MGKTLKKIAIVTGIAAAAGYLAGILTAPQSGKETREDIKQAAQKGFSEAEKQLKKTLAELSDMIDDIKKRSAGVSGRASKELDELVSKGKVARDKAREVLSAIHEGDVNDKDLKLAMSQATDALKHLRAYLSR
jgi:gas vesicle protein